MSVEVSSEPYPGAPVPVAASLTSVGYGLFALQRPVGLDEVASVGAVRAQLASDGHFDPEEVVAAPTSAGAAALLEEWEADAAAEAARVPVVDLSAPVPGAGLPPEPVAEDAEPVDPAKAAMMAEMLRGISGLDDED